MCKHFSPVHLSSGSSSSQARPAQGFAWTRWGQAVPPLEAWCKMTRWRSVNPPEPHLTEHGDQGPHSDTLQSCTEKKQKKILIFPSPKSNPILRMNQAFSHKGLLAADSNSRIMSSQKARKCWTFLISSRASFSWKQKQLKIPSRLYPSFCNELCILH